MTAAKPMTDLGVENFVWCDFQTVYHASVPPANMNIPLCGASLLGTVSGCNTEITAGGDACHECIALLQSREPETTPESKGDKHID